MDDVEFDTDAKYAYTRTRPEEGPHSGMTRVLMSVGAAQNARQAQLEIFWIAVFMFLLAGFILLFIPTGKKHPVPDSILAGTSIPR